jgi:4-amino-4-deoxy-L-arabinose transferase-like glycosyltransferase
MVWPFNSRRVSRGAQFVVLAAVALPYFIHLGTSSLWDANEAFYAETPREMLESGDYIAPRFNHQLRPQKPPLTYWLVLASYKLFGVSEFAVRLPGALAALGVIVFTWGIGRVLFSPFSGTLAAVMIGTTPRFFILARKLPIDILLLFWLTGAAYFLVRALRRPSPSWKSWAPFYLFLGCGFLTKGPVAWVLPGASLALWLVLTRRFTSSLRRLRPLMGLVLLAATVLPWYALIYRSLGRDYIASFFLKDNLGRFATQSFGPMRGPFYYVPTFFADCFPWSILAVAAAFYLWSERTHLRQAGAFQYGFPLVWCAFVFLFFTLSKNKQEHYIAPMYPLLAVLLGGTLRRSAFIKATPNTNRSDYLWMCAFFVLFLLFLALCVFTTILMRSVLPDLSAVLLYLPSAALLVASAALAWQLIRGNLSGCYGSLSCSVWLLLLLAASIYIPGIEPLRPVKEMCRQIASQAKHEDQVGYYEVAVPSMAFYLRRPIFEEFDAESMVQRFRSTSTVFCILTEQDYGYFVGARDLILYVLDRRPRLITRLHVLLDEDSWAEQELLLVSNRPALEPSMKEGRENP